MTSAVEDPAEALARQVAEACIPVVELAADLRQGRLRVLDASGADVTEAKAAEMARVGDLVIGYVGEIAALASSG